MNICAYATAIIACLILNKKTLYLRWNITMRNKAIKFASICNVLNILNVCVFAFSPLCAYAQSTTPDQEVLSFYKKYMIACDEFDNKPKKGTVDDLFCGVDIKRYITEPLLKKLVRSYTAQPTGELLPPWDPNYLGDSDYFLHTQDVDAQWSSFMTAKTIHENKSTSVVRLFMDVPKSSGGPLAICVRAQRDQDRWKIYQVDLSTDNDLPNCKGR